MLRAFGRSELGPLGVSPNAVSFHLSSPHRAVQFSAVLRSWQSCSTPRPPGKAKSQTRGVQDGRGPGKAQLRTNSKLLETTRNNKNGEIVMQAESSWNCAGKASMIFNSSSWLTIKEMECHGISWTSLGSRCAWHGYMAELFPKELYRVE